MRLDSAEWTWLIHRSDSYAQSSTCWNQSPCKSLVIDMLILKHVYSIALHKIVNICRIKNVEWVGWRYKVKGVVECAVETRQWRWQSAAGVGLTVLFHPDPRARILKCSPRWMNPHSHVYCRGNHCHPQLLMWSIKTKQKKEKPWLIFGRKNVFAALDPLIVSKRGESIEKFFSRRFSSANSDNAAFFLSTYEGFLHKRMRPKNGQSKCSFPLFFIFKFLSCIGFRSLESIQTTKDEKRYEAKNKNF